MVKKTKINLDLEVVFSWSAVFLLMVLGIWQFHNSEFYTGFQLVPGGRGDTRLVTALLEYLHHSFHGVGQLVSPAFYYPTRGTLGYADMFLTYAVLYDWLRVGGWDIFTSLQICLLTTNLLNFACCFLFLRKGLGFGILAAGLGAFFFAFNAPKFNQIGHVQLQCLFWLPLIFWCLVDWAKNSKTLKTEGVFKRLALAAVLLNIQLLSSFYASWNFLFWFFLFLFLGFLIPSTRFFLRGLLVRHLKPLLWAALVFVAGLVPFLMIYLPVVLELGGKDYSEVKMMIPNFWSFLWMGPRHGWWGWLWDSCPSIRAFPVEGELRLGFGLALLLVWSALAWAAFRVLRGNGPNINGKKIYIQFAALTILTTTLFCLLAFQYTENFSPWRLVYNLVPGAGSIRAVSRHVLFLALPMAIALSFACHVLLQKAAGAKGNLRPLLRGITFLFAGMIVWEQLNLPPFPAFNKDQELNRLEYLSQKLPASCNVFYATVDPGLPYTATDIQIDAMLISAVRGVPTLNGYSGQSPPNQSWGLFKVRSAKYGEYVRDWIKLHNIQGNVCELKIDR